MERDIIERKNAMNQTEHVFSTAEFGSCLAE